MIDLSKIPLPQSVETLDFETIVTQIKTDLISRDSTLQAALALESETLSKLVEAFAYRELHLRSRINEALKATFITHALGTDLDNLGALFGVVRMVIQEEDLEASPPQKEIIEADSDFRRRILLSLDAFSTAGPTDSYVYHGLSADASVRDISATSPSGGVVDIAVMSQTGLADQALQDLVESKLNTDTIRPLGTQLNISSATAVDYTIEVILHTSNLPEQSIAQQTAQSNLEALRDERFKIGQSIHLSAIYAACHSQGVERVEILQPQTNIEINHTQFANNTQITITTQGE